MGMLMHKTWLEQQDKAEEEKAEQPVAEEETVETDEPQIKRKSGRRKVN